MRRVLVTASALVATASLAAAGCGDSGGAVAREEVEQKIASELAATAGQAEPEISCPGDLDAEVGTTMECDLTAEGDSAVYPVSVEVTSVEGDTVNFDIQVGDAPG